MTITMQRLAVNQSATGAFVSAEAYLDAPAASAFNSMNAKCVRDLGRSIALVEAGRTYARQNYLYQGYLAGRAGFSLAARPGTSRHEVYRAIDWGGDFAIPGTAGWNWRMANAPSFGFIWAGKNFSPRENWHDEWNGSMTAGSGSILITPISELGSDYVKKLQTALGVAADNIVGSETIKALQTKVGTPADGDWGNASTKALQTFVGTGSDGAWGAQTTAAVKVAIDAGKFGAVPGVGSPINLLGSDYVKALQTQLGIDVDGIAGDQTEKALQARLGVTPDGLFQDASVKALQSFIGAGVDGAWGNETTTKFKAALDVKKFAPVVVPPPVVTPPAASANRTANDASINRRSLPTTAVPTIDPGVQANATVTIKAYTTGLSVSGNNVWFQIPDGSWTWSGGYTSQSVAGIPALPTAPTLPAPPVIPSNLVYGIDVAWPQTGTFDWNAIKAAHSFVIIKAAGAETGVYGPADLLDKHLAGARSVGLRAGFYFFNNGNLPVKEQADKFIEVVKSRIKVGDLVALDVEPDGANVPEFTPDQALEFATYVEEALAVKTFMYINRTTMNQDWSKVVAAGHPLWLAVLNGLDASLQTAVKHWSKASIVQFVVGKVSGYPAAVDRNYSTEAAITQYGFIALPALPAPTPEPTPDVGELDKLRAYKIKADAAFKQIRDAATGMLE